MRERVRFKKEVKAGFIGKIKGGHMKQMKLRLGIEKDGGNRVDETQLF